MALVPTSKQKLQLAVRELTVLAESTRSRTAFRKSAELILGRFVDSPAPPSSTVQRQLLTVREKQVLSRIVQGNSNAEIAADLGTSMHTVRNQVALLYRKLGVSSRAECVQVALESRLLRGTPRH